MQVICPNCGARYAVDPLAIGPVGRIVQCARCSHRWLQTVAAAKANAERDAAEAALTAPETAPTSPFAAQPPAAEPEPQTGGSGFSLGPAKPAEPAEPVEAIPDLVIRPPRQRTSLPAVIEARHKPRVPLKIVIGLLILALVATAAASVYLFRDDILPLVPMGWRTMLHLAP
jgi:predicted Zn finger-like uncharacterized protein